MKTTPVPVEELSVIGYADVLEPGLRPTVVPPVFCFVAQPNQVLVPPYSFNAGYVCDATQITAAELAELAAREEVTMLKVAPFQGRRDYELWLNEKDELRYEPRVDAHRLLDKLSEDKLAAAVAELSTGDTKAAEHLAGLALCADDRRFEPLALKAALRRKRGDSTGEQLMAKLARRLVSADAFKCVVDYYASLMGAASVAQYPSDLLSSQPMKGMAALRVCAA